MDASFIGSQGSTSQGMKLSMQGAWGAQRTASESDSDAKTNRFDELTQYSSTSTLCKVTREGSENLKSRAKGRFRCNRDLHRASLLNTMMGGSHEDEKNQRQVNMSPKLLYTSPVVPIHITRLEVSVGFRCNRCVLIPQNKTQESTRGGKKPLARKCRWKPTWFFLAFLLENQGATKAMDNPIALR